MLTWPLIYKSKIPVALKQNMFKNEATWFFTICLKVFESRPRFSTFNLISLVTRATWGRRNFMHCCGGLARFLFYCYFCQMLPLHLVLAAPLAPQGTKSASPRSELRGVVCVIRNRELEGSPRADHRWGDDWGAGGGSQTRSSLPAVSEVISSAQVLFSAVSIVRSRSFVFLSLLLFLRQTVRPFLTHAHLALPCFSSSLRLAPCWA